MLSSLRRSLASQGRRQQQSHRPRTRIHLLVEALELRAVPSVIIGQSGGTLSITDNDTSGHAIYVDQTATQGSFTVQVDSGGASTYSGISNIKANLGADSATLLLNGGGFSTTLSGNLTVTAADGNNAIYEDLSTIQGNVSVTEGNGSDVVELDGTAISGNLSVTQGNGNADEVNCAVNSNYLDNSSFSGSTTIGGNVSVTQGDGTQVEGDQVNFGGYVGYLYGSSFSAPTTIGGNVSAG